MALGLNTTMAYSFTGFFVVGSKSRPECLPKGTIWRKVTSPFQGIAALLPPNLGHKIGLEEIRVVGNDTADDCDWMFLRYETWGGKIDFVYGLGSAGGEDFGPVEDSEDDTVETTYEELMRRIGIAPEHSRNFAPFERDFFAK